MSEEKAPIAVIGEQSAQRTDPLKAATPGVVDGPLIGVEAAESLEAGGSARLPHAQYGLTVYDALLMLMVLIWAANPAAIKWALDYLDPLTFNALRFALAALVPVGLLLAGREGLRWQRGDGWKLLVLGLVGHGIYQTLFIIGISNTLAGNVALILSVSPAFIAIFGALLGLERIKAYAWAGIAITLAGIALVVLGSGKPLELGSRLLGDGIMLVATMLWGLYTVLSGPLLRRYSSSKLNALTMPVGSVWLLVVAGPSIVAGAPGWGRVPVLAWVVLVVSGLLAVSLSYIIWYKGVQQLGATRTAVYTNLVPVLAALISFTFLKEPLGWPFWTGMVLVLAGVSLTRFGGRLGHLWHRRAHSTTGSEDAPLSSDRRV
jgi:drug/metabolite transporter (DMT)-like permease